MSNSYHHIPSSSSYLTSEDEVAIRLLDKLTHKFSKKDIRDIYRIIHLLLDVLTEDEKYNHHYNKYLIIMHCLHRFYAFYPNSRMIIQSYSAFVSEKLHEIKRDKYNTQSHKERSSLCKYCVIS